MKGIVDHVRRWNIWRKNNANGKLHHLLVLLGLVHSPTLYTVLLPEEWDEIEKKIVSKSMESVMVDVE